MTKREKLIEKMAFEWAEALYKTLGEQLDAAPEIIKHNQSPHEIISLAVVLLTAKTIRGAEKFHHADFETLLHHHMHGVQAAYEHFFKET